MRAVVMRRHGGPDVLVPTELPDPEPGPGEAAVAVRAVAVNRLDCLVRENSGHAYVARLPLVPGYDVAGEVVAVGPATAGARPGDRVYVHYDYACGRCRFCLDGDESLCAEYGIMGVDRDGGYAERVVAPVRNLFALPAGVPFAAAAASGSVFLTAHHMLFARGRLKPGETVLVMAAGSGVGGAALQLARWAGARVVATAGTRAKRERALAAGAEHVIDYTEPGWSARLREVTGGRGADLAIDHTGSEHFAEVVRGLAPRGRVVVCGATSGAAAELDLVDLFARQISIIGSSDGTRRELVEVLELLARGVIAPVIDEVLPLDAAADAQRRLTRRDHYGRLLLAPSDGPASAGAASLEAPS
ncbi:MAG TPA: zinc-binding dehydrogenase [Gemmatimonadaceae bacterium]|nr:zinc-binding dehydrogenase [Gemmatimonadaceae bacterium]